MVTINVKILQSQTDVSIPSVMLDQHTPVDVMKKVAQLAPKKKPPPGSIWLMRPVGWQFGDPVIDQFDTFLGNNIDESIHYELVEVG